MKMRHDFASNIRHYFKNGSVIFIVCLLQSVLCQKSFINTAGDMRLTSHAV